MAYTLTPKQQEEFDALTTTDERVKFVVDTLPTVAARDRFIAEKEKDRAATAELLQIEISGKYIGKRKETNSLGDEFETKVYSEPQRRPVAIENYQFALDTLDAYIAAAKGKTFSATTPPAAKGA